MRDLRQRHLILKSGSDRWQEVFVPRLDDPNISYSDLYDRCRDRWACLRTDVEKEIAGRRKSPLDRIREE